MHLEKNKLENIFFDLWGPGCLTLSNRITAAFMAHSKQQIS